jgi:hypothetical protein
MIGLGEQRRFGEELAFGSCEKHQSSAMTVVPDHLDAAFYDREYSISLVALAK